MSSPAHHHRRGTTSRSRGMGRWLPHDQAVLTSWVNDLIVAVDAAAGDTLKHAVTREFSQLIDDDPVVRMYLTQMIEQAPSVKRPANPDLFFQVNLKSVEQLLRLLDHVLDRSLPFGGRDDPLVGFPINAILDWCMGTPAGNAAFRHHAVNAMFRKILNAFGNYLSSSESRYVLNDSPTGWKSAEAIATTGMDDFVYDPDDEYWGFASWNDFFIRRFKNGVRPIADPEDDKVIVSTRVNRRRTRSRPPSSGTTSFG